MSSKRTRAGWISYYFEYDVLMSTLRTLVVIAGALLYLSVAIALFILSGSLTIGIAGKLTLYMIAILLMIIISYTVPVESEKRVSTGYRARTITTRSTTKTRSLTVIVLLVITTACYIFLCTIT